MKQKHRVRGLERIKEIRLEDVDRGEICRTERRDRSLMIGKSRQIIMIDSTKLDVFLHNIGHQPMGVLPIIVVLDLCNRSIVAWQVTHEAFELLTEATI